MILVIYVLIKTIIHFFVSDLNAQDNALNTPLHIAVENDSLDAVNFLLEM